MRRHPFGPKLPSERRFRRIGFLRVVNWSCNERNASADCSFRINETSEFFTRVSRTATAVQTLRDLNVEFHLYSEGMC